MKTFTEKQFLNPWHWCLSVFEKHELLDESKTVAEAIMAPRSTVRALFNGQNSAPRYDTLMSMLKLCVDLEYNGAEEVFKHARSEDTSDRETSGYYPGSDSKVAEKQLTIEDLL